MLDLLLIIFEALGEILLEAALQAAAEFLGVLILRAIAEVFETAELRNPLLACPGYALFGAVAGGLSLFIFPHRLFHPSAIPGLSVIVSPFLVGLSMSAVGRILKMKNRKTTQLETFGYGFFFAFGMALIRFAFVS